MNAKSTSRIVGLLLLVQLTGLIVPFVLLRPMVSANFLATAAGSSLQIKTAVFLLFANCALTIGLSITAFRVFQRYSHAAAVLLTALSVIMFSLQAVDNTQLMSMLALSERYVQAGASGESFETLSAVVRATRRWAHYSELLAIDAWMFALHGSLYRFRLVPRALAAFGLLTVLLHFAAIPVPLFLGYRGVMVLGVPVAFSHTALAIWMLVKGFDERPHPLSASSLERPIS